MEKYLQIICFDIDCIAMSVNLLEINIAMYVALSDPKITVQEICNKTFA